MLLSINHAAVVVGYLLFEAVEAFVIFFLLSEYIHPALWCTTSKHRDGVKRKGDKTGIWCSRIGDRKTWSP